MTERLTDGQKRPHATEHAGEHAEVSSQPSSELRNPPILARGQSSHGARFFITRFAWHVLASAAQRVGRLDVHGLDPL
jgi:hypothetical protein